MARENAGAVTPGWLNSISFSSLSLFFLGGPGTGKISHSERLAENSHLQIHHINFLDLAKQAFGFNSKQPFYIGFEKFTIFAQNKGCCTHLMKCNENAFGEEENDDDANKLEKEES